MSCAFNMDQEVGRLRAQLDEVRLALARAEGERAGFERALAIVASARAVPVAAPAPICHAPSVTVTHASVTPSVTGEEKEDRERRLARERKQDSRARRRSVTVTHASVTPSVTQKKEKKIIQVVPPPSPPPPEAPVRGALAVVSAAARDARPAGLKEHRTPDTLPPPVAKLREGWNTLVAPYGFRAWGERTSRELLRDVLSALERRPIEEWLQVFALVPRSPVCRGELRSGQRTGLVYLLTGRTTAGYEPAEQLLTGAWTVDPLPEARAPAQANPTPVSLPEPEDTPAARAWHAVLQTLLTDGKTYALSWLRDLRGREVREGSLVLEARDRYQRDWVDTHYGELLRQYTALLGHAGYELVLPEESTP